MYELIYELYYKIILARIHKGGLFQIRRLFQSMDWK